MVDYFPLVKMTLKLMGKEKDEKKEPNFAFFQGCWFFINQNLNGGFVIKFVAVGEGFENAKKGFVINGDLLDAENLVVSRVHAFLNLKTSVRFRAVIDII